jgi:hypothetical protein
MDGREVGREGGEGRDGRTERGEARAKLRRDFKSKPLLFTFFKPLAF